ncbi:hypothetical protein RUND412_000254 [Rhizina undulata]
MTDEIIDSENFHRAWWKEVSVYQIYPSSFSDSNGDGIGDIKGIISKLDYIRNLGADCVWLSPVYKSPQKDMGYDIADYRQIDPRYGTVEDIENLVDGLHKRGIKLIMDLVVNHTSDQHKWFLESKSSKDNPKRDWYIWRPPRYDANGNRRPPNNWESIFGGSAWKYDETTDEYFLHLFCPEQPDLNWEQPLVRTEVWNIMKFWLDRKIDGFRMDVVNLISKVPGLPDAPVQYPDKEFQPGMVHFANGPRLHEFLREMRREVLSKYDVLTVGEMPWVEDPNEVIKVVGRKRNELDMIFQFDVVDIDNGPNGKFDYRRWTLPELKEIVNRWQRFMLDHDGWNALFIENHDQSRSVSRLTSDAPEFRPYAAKMLGTFLVLQSGTIFLHQGQELGLANVPKHWGIEEYKDVETINYYNEVLEKRGGDKSKMADVMAVFQKKARDNGRTPMQWDSTPNAGFTTGNPWMRVNEDYPTWNAAQQTADPKSVWSHYKHLLSLRQKYKDIFVYGDFTMLSPEDAEVFAYKRTYQDSAAIVILNFTEKEVAWKLPGNCVVLSEEKVLVGTYGPLRVESGKLVLRPFEAVVVLH